MTTPPKKSPLEQLLDPKTLSALTHFKQIAEDFLDKAVPDPQPPIYDDPRKTTAPKDQSTPPPTSLGAVTQRANIPVQQATLEAAHKILRDTISNERGSSIHTGPGSHIEVFTVDDVKVFLTNTFIEMTKTLQRDGKL